MRVLIRNSHTHWKQKQTVWECLRSNKHAGQSNGRAFLSGHQHVRHLWHSRNIKSFCTCFGYSKLEKPWESENDPLTNHPVPWNILWSISGICSGYSLWVVINESIGIFSTSGARKGLQPATAPPRRNWWDKRTESCAKKPLTKRPLTSWRSLDQSSSKA